MAIQQGASALLMGSAYSDQKIVTLWKNEFEFIIFVNYNNLYFIYRISNIEFVMIFTK